MTQLMNPTEVADALRDAYLHYLETSFYLKDPSLRKQFSQLLRDKEQPPLVREPILEVSPGFQSGKSLENMIAEGLISQSFCRLEDDSLTRSLYLHQNIALTKTIKEKRNIVVATGTGSGKTETFLYPVLNHLLKEKDAGTLSQPGVRALLLYPMNALANDQIKRLRSIAKLFPEITFGRYTGETDQSTSSALATYRHFHGGEDPLSNELISRDQLRERPPHILFTNYAMLEYLLIRPADITLFQGGTWRFLILDEVHTYSGALGIEIAMLLRRLKERVVNSEKGKLQCIGTSATLGAGESDFPKIAEFASQLFGEPFDANDIIGAKYKGLEPQISSWGKGSAEMYAALRDAIFVGNQYSLDHIKGIVKDYVPDSVTKPVLESISEKIGAEKSRCQAYIYILLSGDENVQHLRKKLYDDRAIELSGLSEIEGLLDLVALGAFAKHPKSQDSLVPARYHIMARAISGVYAWFNDNRSPQLIAKRKRSHRTPDDKDHGVFELGSCNRCGEVMIVGVREDIENRSYLRQPPDVGDDPIESLRWFTLKDTEVIADDDDLVEEESQERLERLSPVRLCRICGRIDDAGTFDLAGCEGHDSDIIEVYEIENKNYRSVPRQCPSCKNNHGTVASRILTGKEIPVAVLTTALYQKIPPSTKADEASLPGGGRKLLMFSDSRQDAAFFAPFMDKTYNKFKQRRYLVQALLSANRPLDLEGWANKALKMAEEAGEWEESIGSRKRSEDAKSWVLREWIATDRRLALEGAGIVFFKLRKPQAFQSLEVFSNRPWDLNPEIQWALIQILLDTIRYQGIVVFDEEFSGINHDNELFKPRNFNCYLRGSGSNAERRIYAWEPARDSNKRLDYLMRILQQKGISKEQAFQEALNALREIWSAIIHPNGPLNKLFKHGESHRGENNLSCLSTNWWEAQLAGNEDVMRCNTCGIVTAFSVNNVCPMSGCKGSVQPYPNEERQKNHYYKLFTEMKPIPLTVLEHTAQLTKIKAARTQQEFIDGKVNLLSCTTTFELGVDVGDLQTVIMRNMPPNPGNYVQRAGRAGRRVDNIAIIVTYAQRRTHDYAYFDHWPRMVRGSIRPPSIHLNNLKVIRRHVHAEAMAAYFHNNPDVFADKLESLFDPSHQRTDELFAFLSRRSDILLNRLKRIVPANLHTELGLDAWSWLGVSNDNAEDESFARRLDHARQDVQIDWSALQKLTDEAGQNRKYGLADFYNKQLNTLKQRSLLGKLGTHGLMPKYGFPTDVVELKVRNRAEQNVELERDMKLALSEFAPGNQIVAGGKVWTSRGIVLPSGERRLHQYNYWHCDTCRYFEAALATDADEEKRCHCDQSLRRKTYIYPEFGFTTAMSEGSAEVGESRPSMKSYSEIFFYNVGDESEFTPIGNIPSVKHRVSKQGWIYVVNDNRDQNFFVCTTCGFATAERPRVGANERHYRPWTSDQLCNTTSNFLKGFALGYRYRTDVLELRLPTENLGNLSLQDVPHELHSLWLSVLYALVNGACQSLDINERDLGGCLYYSSNEQHPELVLFDTAPGGAGFVHDIKENFLAVLDRAKKLLDCSSCGEDSSCIACLRTYYNQRDHNKLKRGLAKKYLETIV